MNLPLKPLHLHLSLFLVASALVASAASSSLTGVTTEAGAESTSNTEGRVILLGFDGADARTVRELMASRPGEYPTFEKLAKEGTFAPLQVVAPPESPVSWAAINTGQNPAKTGVPGFIQRSLVNSRTGEPSNPSPTFGHIEFNKPTPIGELEGAPSMEGAGNEKGMLAGGGVFLGLLIVLMLATRKLPVALLLGLAGGGATFYLVADHFEQQAISYMPDEFPVTRNPNKATNFWDHTAEAGVQTIVLDAAQAFDMQVPEGAKVLSGLGVPDAKGLLGEWAVYTTNPEETATTGRRTNTAGYVFRVDAYGGVINTAIYGPDNFWLKEQLTKQQKDIEAESKKPVQRSLEESLELSKSLTAVKDEIKALRKDATTGKATVPMEIEVSGQAADITVDGVMQRVGVGDWSEFYELEFVLNPGLSIKAITRVRLVSVEPFVEVFVNVLDIDPREPPFWQPISDPPEFAAELASDCGLYETYGWPTTTMPVKDKVVDPELLMEDVEFTMKWREKLTHSVLGRDDWRVLMSVFSTTDRVQHMMYQFYDEQHPLYDSEVASREMTFFGETIKLSEAIPAIYKQMDRVIGDVLEKLQPADTLMVCSDHGFQTFRRQVHVNNWLIQEGFMVRDESARAMRSPYYTKSLSYVDWSKTRVYSLGMGFLYVNLKGREMNGIVAPEEVDALLAEVRTKLLAATDPEGGAKICKEVYVTKEVHDGPYLHLEGDMIIGFSPTYRVGWTSTSGGISTKKDSSGKFASLNPICTDNTSPWSGGHISVALPDVAGVFFSNRQVDGGAEGIRSLQLAPTILDLVGVTLPAAMDLGPLTVR